MLEEEHLCRIGWEDEVLLNLLFLFTTKWWIRKHDIISILVLYITNIGRKSIYFANIWIVYSMQYHIHDTKYIRKWSLLIPEEGIIIQKFEFLICLYLWLDMIECFDKKSTATSCRVIDRLSDLRIYEVYYELDDTTRRVELS